MPTRTVAQLATSFKKSPEEVVALATELGFECSSSESELELDAVKTLKAHIDGSGKVAQVVRKTTQPPRATPEQQIQRKQNASSRVSRGQLYGDRRTSSAATVVVKTGPGPVTAPPTRGAETPVITAKTTPTGGLARAKEASSELKRQAAEIREEQAKRREAEKRDQEEKERRLQARKEVEQRKRDAIEAKRREAEQRATEAAKSTQPATQRPATDKAAKPAKQKETTGRGNWQRSQDNRTNRNGRRGSGGLREITKGDDERGRIPRVGRRRGGSRPLDRVAELEQGGGFQRPAAAFVQREVELGESIAVGALAQAMSIKAAELIMKLMEQGVMVTINEVLDRDTATLIVEELGHKVKLAATQEEQLIEATKVEGEEFARSPVVTVMGHVDHGKTSLLDYIRQTRVAAGEAGGITQHIGAYHLTTSHGEITFLDTPGHAAFSAMRARGANSTDIVVLVCAANDGVMPQTEEAVNHAKAANVPLVVAVNKIDLESADPQRVRTELAGLEVVAEEFGGTTQFINVSAETGEGIDELLEAISTQAEIMELNAVPETSGRGLVIESKLERGRGPVVSLLVQNGTLKQGDVVIAGENYGKVRSIIDDQGRKLKDAGPSIPVEVLGFNGTPEAGEAFSVSPDERQARQLADERAHENQSQQQQLQQRARMDDMFKHLGKGEKRVLNVILKADVRGSLEAINHAFSEIGNDEVAVQVLGLGIGGINESDVNMALTYDAMVFGFNVRADKPAKVLLDRNRMEVRYYRVIYELLDDVKALLSGMLMPEEREEIVGTAEVREVFSSPRFGQVAGCLVIEGTVFRNKRIRVLRDHTVIYEGELESLRRFKDDVQEVNNGIECGIGVRNYNDVRSGDLIEVYETREVARAL
ncbi:MAG: translation initiation factor IF-2 [Gammaproteobacteria bacterium]|nr:translation initiation factor IF-2 [Gammaproteobacteria bacterium]